MLKEIDKRVKVDMQTQFIVTSPRWMITEAPLREIWLVKNKENEYVLFEIIDDNQGQKICLYRKKR